MNERQKIWYHHRFARIQRALSKIESARNHVLDLHREKLITAEEYRNMIVPLTDAKDVIRYVYQAKEREYLDNGGQFVDVERSRSLPIFETAARRS